MTEQIIDKTIHYVWVGGAKKPDFVNACIRNWKLTLPDYKVIEWSEINLDIDEILSKSEFVSECYKRNLWAFVSDYIRIKILFEYGGLYLDTDITLEKNITPLLNDDVFLGKEDERYINAGVIGAKPGHRLFKRMIEIYEGEIMGMDIYTIPQLLTHLYEHETELFHGVKVYDKEYFYPYRYDEEFNESAITKNTFCIHWWGKSWGGKDDYFLIYKHLTKFQRIIKITRDILYKIRCQIKSNIKKIISD